MKIRPTQFAAEVLPPRLQKVAPPKEEQEPADVRVAVSAAAKALATREPEEPVDAEKVARLRALIEAGTYEIDDQALAQALIDKELRWKP
jgi:flagellar biosynthesis anti-sigma factor FlgM